ncbi:hypothetical protein BT96DRAFT_824417 [Gymnopus androsaceus JB14]|uniref:Uncharacterized protein n=1 Tax=Gymnopus androsaceus JB14 TaxID=1447944 RepID=A0A6A4HFX5_9AGAR|nr:hypothetical protein BT96DRAFT_824417 [Gymnopus androsaceus JB14]
MTNTSVNGFTENRSERISELTGEFWDIGRCMSAASARCLMIEKQLRDSGQLIGSGSECDGRFLILRPEFAYANFRTPELYENLVKADDRLQEEQKQCVRMEMALEDVLRECRQPTVVPELLAAFARMKA